MALEDDILDSEAGDSLVQWENYVAQGVDEQFRSAAEADGYTPKALRRAQTGVTGFVRGVVSQVMTVGTAIASSAWRLITGRRPTVRRRGGPTATEAPPTPASTFDQQLEEIISLAEEAMRNNPELSEPIYTRANLSTQNLSRAEVNRTAAIAAELTARQLGAEGIVWVSERDACVHCIGLAGEVARFGEPFTGFSPYAEKQLGWAGYNGRPPRHPNCFPAGVVVSGPGVEATSRRWFDGELVEITIEGGNVLPVTPNHPVLTSQGWVSAGLIQEGSYVVSSRGLERVLALNPDDHQSPSLIEDVTASLNGALGMSVVRMPTTAEDFHGDGGHGEVEIVSADRLLGDGAEIPQPLSHQEFCGTNPPHTLLSGGSDSLPMGVRLDGASDGLVGSTDLISPLVGGHVLPLQELGLATGTGDDSLAGKDLLDHVPSNAQLVRNALDAIALLEESGDEFRVVIGSTPQAGMVSDGDVVPHQEAVDDLAGDAILTGQREFTLTPEVGLDKVIGVRRIPWSGHVYNLETTGGWYISNSIIVHNCRCRLIPWDGSDDTVLPLKREAERSVARGWSLPTESKAARLRALDRLLQSPTLRLPPSVVKRARKALAERDFPEGRNFPG